MSRHVISGDVAVLRELARRYMDVAAKDVQASRRDIWRRHNSLEEVVPPIYIRAFAWIEMPEAHCTCEDPLYRKYEDLFRQSLFRDSFADDYIVEPWVAVDAAWVLPEGGLWGPPIPWAASDDPRGARKWDPPIKDPDDFDLLVPPQHVIDERETARRAERLRDAIGDIIPVVVDRAPAYRFWDGEISAHLAWLRGLEQIMWDMMDRPEWLHKLLAFMRDGIIRTHEQAEAAGDWKLCDSQNQGLAYSRELPDPSASDDPVTRKQLWYFCASQELALVGPKQFDEFMLQYQIPIMAPFGLAAYGCCEDLTRKIPLLRKIPNLRRISVAFGADVGRCAEQIGTDYVFSYRPSPSAMVGYQFDPEYVRSFLKQNLTACRGCRVDLTLKDVETVQGDPNRIREWVAIAREVIDDVWHA